MTGPPIRSDEDVSPDGTKKTEKLKEEPSDIELTSYKTARSTDALATASTRYGSAQALSQAREQNRFALGAFKSNCVQLQRKLNV